MKVIAVMNRKGGVAKSTTATHLGAGLALRGQRVLIVDCDPQGQCAPLLSQQKADDLYALLIDDAAPEDVVLTVPPHRYTLEREPPGLLALLRGDTGTEAIPFKRNELLVLAQALQYVGHAFAFDVILLDTPPSAPAFTAAIHAACDGVLFVTTAKSLSLDGLRESIRAFDAFNAERARDAVAPMEFLGVLPTVIAPNTRVQRRNLEHLGALQEHLWPPVFQRAVWEEAAYLGVTVFAHRPDSDAARDAWQAVDQLERKLAAWS